VTAAQGAGELGPIAGYLPHQPPMRLLDDIVEVTDNRAVCRATIRPDCVFAVDGRVHPAAMIEYVAQACAVYAGVVSARDGGGPRLGLIMACREVDFLVDGFAVGDELTIAAQKVFAGSQMAAFTGTVRRGDQVCATIQLSVIDAEYAAALPPGSPGSRGSGDDA
jgi:predicted hotdog family 3-hydroxylacyl-ACP dehydratase